MKTLIVLSLLAATTAYAMTSEFVVNSITSYSGTQTATAIVDYTTPVIIQTASSGVSWKINGTGTALPLVANIQHKYQPGGSVSSIVFSQTSSASPFTVYVVK